MTNVKNNKASEEQMAYAGVLNVGMWLGLAILVITFFIYISGVLPSYVQLEDLSRPYMVKVGDPAWKWQYVEEHKLQNTPLWSMRVNEFNHIKEAPTGWHWAALVGKGDYLNFIGIAMLAGLTILCYLVILPILFRKKDTAYAIIAIVEVLVLSLAASGLLKVGGH